MKNLTYLHNHKDFKDLLSIVGKELNINPQLIEKDYWLMQGLYGLQEAGINFEMKGGTSLSKGYKIIKRFSEDIDIKVIPPNELKVSEGKNQNSKPQIESRRVFFEWLFSQIKIDGIIEVERDVNYDDKKLMRNAGIRLKYKSHFSDIPKLKEGILLEVGFDSTTPNKKISISSWAYDYAIDRRVKIIDNQAKNVLCYSPNYTLVEKLQAISTKFRQQQENGSFPTNFMRHYYDVYQLLNEPSVIAFIGTSEYYNWKDERFRQNDNKNLSKNEAFLLSDSNVYKMYKEAYEKSIDLYYDGQVPFEEILAKIKSNINNL